MKLGTIGCKDVIALGVAGTSIAKVASVSASILGWYLGALAELSYGDFVKGLVLLALHSVLTIGRV